MVSSMTGFGLSEFVDKGIKYSVEIKSVNHRYIDVIIKLPKRSFKLEEIIKKKVKGIFNRGYIEVYIYQENSNQPAFDVKYNKNAVKAYLDIVKDIKDNFRLDGNISLDTLFQIKEIFTLEEVEPLDAKSLINAIDSAVVLLKEMRLKEGLQIWKDMASRVDSVLAHLKKIRNFVPRSITEYQDKLKQRIDLLLLDLKESSELDAHRLSQEIALHADKCDITEELIRIESHINQLRGIVDSDQSVGRKIDFILQEMNRETNTITAKANNYDIIALAIEMKSEIERMREQAQNIE